MHIHTSPQQSNTASCVYRNTYDLIRIIYTYNATMNKTLARFLRYTIVGLSTFFFDLFLLYLFIHTWQINYIAATIYAYIIAVTINYYFSRTYVFPQTLRRVDHGYYMFIAIASLGLLFVTVSMKILVDVFHQNYFISRTIIAAMVGIWNYLTNLFFNFRVAGKH